MIDSTCYRFLLVFLSSFFVGTKMSIELNLLDGEDLLVMDLTIVFDKTIHIQMG